MASGESSGAREAHTSLVAWPPSRLFNMAKHTVLHFMFLSWMTSVLTKNVLFSNRSRKGEHLFLLCTSGFSLVVSWGFFWTRPHLYTQKQMAFPFVWSSLLAELPVGTVKDLSGEQGGRSLETDSHSRAQGFLLQSHKVCKVSSTYLIKENVFKQNYYSGKLFLGYVCVPTMTKTKIEHFLCMKISKYRAF